MIASPLLLTPCLPTGTENTNITITLLGTTTSITRGGTVTVTVPVTGGIAAIVTVPVA
jgi:hypothetical protein